MYATLSTKVHRGYNEYGQNHFTQFKHFIQFKQVTCEDSFTRFDSTIQFKGTFTTVRKATLMQSTQRTYQINKNNDSESAKGG